MLEDFIILIVFIVAMGYLGYVFKQNFVTKDDDSCAKGCGCASQKVNPKSK